MLHKAVARMEADVSVNLTGQEDWLAVHDESRTVE